MKKPHKLQHQIIFTNGAIGILLIAMFFTSIYFLNWKTAQAAQGATIQALDTIMSNFEAETVRLNTLTDLCRNDSSFVLSTANRFEIPDFVEKSMEASNKLSLIRYSLPYATNVFMYVQNSDTIIRMNRSVLPLDLFLPYLQRKLAEGETLPDFSALSNGFHTYENFALYCKWVQNYGCLVIEIDTNSFCNLNEIAEGLQSEIFILDDNMNQIFAATNRSMLGIIENIPDDKTAWQAIPWNGKSYEVAQNVMPRTGYRFIMVSHNTLLQESRELLILFAILSVILPFIACLLLVMLNKRIYNPLRSIIKKMDNKGSNELVAISDRFEELVTENSLINAELLSQRELQADFAISYIFHSNGMPEKMIFDTLKNRYYSYYVVVLAIQDKDGRCPDLLSETDIHLVSTLNGHSVRIDKFTHAYLIPIEEDSEIDILEKLSSYLASKELDIDTFAFAGISDIEYNIETLYDVYRKARERMLDCVIPTAKQYSITHDDTKVDRTNKALSHEVQNIIVQSVLNGASQETEALLHRILTIDQATTLRKLIALYQNLCSLLSVLFSNLPEGNEHEWKTQRNRPVYCPLYMYDVILDDCETAKRLSTSNQQALRYQIIDYIKDNYTQQLSLDSIAEEFGITSVYLSTWFKKNVGVNLSVYLTNFRMERAKELLRTERNIKVAELAVRVGISNASTFNRNFKSHTGVTPDQYRKLLDASTELL